MPLDDAPDLNNVFSAVSAKARTYGANKTVHEVSFIDSVANLGKCSTLRNFFDAVHERAQIPRSDLRVSHELHEVVNDYHRAPLNLHTPVIQRSHK